MDLVAVAAPAAIVRVIYFLEYRQSTLYDFLHLDPLYYHDWAVRIASGDWLGARVFEQSPLYPYLLAVWYSLAGHGVTPLYLLQFALGSLTAALTCLLGRRLFGRAPGVAAGVGAALFGPFLFYEGQVMKEFLAPLLSVGVLLLLYKGLGIGPAASAPRPPASGSARGSGPSWITHGPIPGSSSGRCSSS